MQVPTLGDVNSLSNLLAYCAIGALSGVLLSRVDGVSHIGQSSFKALPDGSALEAKLDSAEAMQKDLMKNLIKKESAFHAGLSALVLIVFLMASSFALSADYPEIKKWNDIFVGHSAASG
ncbi:hypothetical protein [Rhodovulum marinum]|uniref:hypothetical protein n=1 Tax=Rhodovulum marinum TaxID=320662 RepID=UPI001A9D5EE9|nr:hypothetical protein [Rhodovulum marinum]